MIRDDRVSNLSADLMKHESRKKTIKCLFKWPQLMKHLRKATFAFFQIFLFINSKVHWEKTKRIQGHGWVRLWAFLMDWEIVFEKRLSSKESEKKNLREFSFWWFINRKMNIYTSSQEARKIQILWIQILLWEEIFQRCIQGGRGCPEVLDIPGRLKVRKNNATLAFKCHFL